MFIRSSVTMISYFLLNRSVNWNSKIAVSKDIDLLTKWSIGPLICEFKVIEYYSMVVSSTGGWLRTRNTVYERRAPTSTMSVYKCIRLHMHLSRVFFACEKYSSGCSSFFVQVPFLYCHYISWWWDIYDFRGIRKRQPCQQRRVVFQLAC